MAPQSLCCGARERLCRRRQRPVLRLYNDRHPTPMSSLILTLPPATGPAAPEYDFVVLRDDGQTDDHGRALASLLPPGARQTREVVAVMPAAMLSWHSLALPARVAAGLLSGRTDAPRARAVLGGALEEHLLDEPEQLHFAVFGGPDAQTLWVAV